jgi:ABC-type tungstate transport system substrate-binding protein
MVKCPYCGKELDLKVILSSDSDQLGRIAAPAETKWYYSDISVIIALLCFGPFALHLVWKNPRYKPLTKCIITVLIIAVTVYVTMKLYSQLQATSRQLQELGFH